MCVFHSFCLFFFFFLFELSEDPPQQLPSPFICLIVGRIARNTPAAIIRIMTRFAGFIEPSPLFHFQIHTGIPGAKVWKSNRLIPYFCPAILNLTYFFMLRFTTLATPAASGTTGAHTTFFFLFYDITHIQDYDEQNRNRYADCCCIRNDPTKHTSPFFLLT